jgi:hypothetical protein
MTARRTVAIAAASAFILALGAPGVAQAGDRGHKRHGHHHHHHYHHVPPGHVRVYHPAPVYYAPAPVYVAPAPMYYAPPPVYAVPSRPVISFGAVIPLR